MNLFEAAVRTYDANQALVGVQLDKEGYAPLAPVGHWTTKADVEIVLNPDGSFVSARMVGDKEPKFIYPLTEDSAARSGPAAVKIAHPLCERLDYLAGDNTVKLNAYLGELGAWLEKYPDNETLRAVFTYVSSGSIMADIGSVLAKGAKPKKGKGKEKGKEKKAAAEAAEAPDASKETPESTETEGKIKDLSEYVVRWILAKDDARYPCWLDQELFRIWQEYYINNKIERKGVCMLTGEYVPLAAMSAFAKGVVPKHGNAKIISSNDKRGFTYRGRFNEASEAISFGYVASQKAHNALRWLVENNGVMIGHRVYLCWNPSNARCFDVVRRTPLDGDDAAEDVETYKKQLHAKLYAEQTEFFGDEDGVFFTMLDSLIPGRLGVLGYEYLSGSEYLRLIEEWDAHCAWKNGKYGVQAPSLFALICNAYGVQHSSGKGKNKSFRMDMREEIKAMHLSRMIPCRLGQAEIPKSLIDGLVDHASAPTHYDDRVWLNILHSACSIINMAYYRKTGKDVMEDTAILTDRSYLFGRLLAVMERAELDWQYQHDEYRATTSQKNMMQFRRKPMEVVERVHKWLETAYLHRMTKPSAARYRKLFGEIISQLEAYPADELNAPLSPIYLIGYNNQREFFFKKKDKAETETNSNNEKEGTNA